MEPSLCSGCDSGSLFMILLAMASCIATKMTAGKSSSIWNLIVVVLQKINDVTGDANIVKVVEVKQSGKLLSINLTLHIKSASPSLIALRRLALS